MGEDGSSCRARNRGEPRRTADVPSSAQATGGDRGSSDALIHGDLTNVVLGAFYLVYNDLKSGHLESVYANALAVVLREASLDIRREAPIEVMYHGHAIGFFRADLLVEGRLIVETKTTDAIASEHVSQVVNYLRASDLEVGLILAFGQQPRFKRVVVSRSRKPAWRGPNRGNSAP